MSMLYEENVALKLKCAALEATIREIVAPVDFGDLSDPTYKRLALVFYERLQIGTDALRGNYRYDNRGGALERASRKQVMLHADLFGSPSLAQTRALD